MSPDFQSWVNFRMSLDDTRVGATQVVGANAFGRVPETGGSGATFWRELLGKASLVEEGQEEAVPEETLEELYGYARVAGLDMREPGLVHVFIVGKKPAIIRA